MKNYFTHKLRKISNFYAFCAIFYLVVVFILFTSVFDLTHFPIDFSAYYTASLIMQKYPISQLYNFNLQQIVQQSHFSFTIPLNPFDYPPVVAWFAYPLAYFPYSFSYKLFIFFNSFVFLLTYFLIYKKLINRKHISNSIILLLSAISFYPFFQVYFQAQISFFILLAMILGWYFISQRKYTYAGISLLVLWVKPQLLLFPIILFIWKRQWNILKSFTLASVFLWIFAFILFSPSGIQTYFEQTQTLLNAGKAYALSPFFQPTLLGVIKNITGEAITSHVLAPYYVSIFLSLLIFYFFWKGNWKPGTATFNYQWSSLLIFMILISPHLHYHELSLLIIPTLFIVQSIQKNELFLKLVCYFLIAFFLSLGIVYVAVLVMVVELIILYKMIQRNR